MEDSEQEEFDTQMQQRELAMELQVLREFYTQILLLYLIDYIIEVSVEDKTSLGIKGAPMDTPPQIASITFFFF